MDDAATARAIVDANAYMTIASADATGRPWASPVWFAHDRYTALVWVSRPDARHSRNVTVRPEVGVVIFDSTVADGEGRGVYLDAIAGEADDADIDALLAVFSARSVERGGTAWTRADVTADAALRLYVARAVEQFVLDDHDRRVPITMA